MNTIHLRPLLICAALSFGMAWLVALPLWLDHCLGHPLFGLFGVATMWTPALPGAVPARFTLHSGSVWPAVIPALLALALFHFDWKPHGAPSHV